MCSHKLFRRTPLETGRAKLLYRVFVITVLKKMPFKYNFPLTSERERGYIKQTISTSRMSPVLCMEGQEGSKEWHGRGWLFLVFVKLNFLFRKRSELQ